MSTVHGRFVWYELMTRDLASGVAFYRDVIGWKAQDSGIPGMAYTILLAGDTPMGGAMALPPEACAAGAPPGWIGYIAVDDVDRCAEHVLAAGGAVHRPAEDIPTVGRFAVVADPQGAAFVVFRGEGTPAPDAPSGPGFVGWRELMATDASTAFDFYASLFGWTKCDTIDMGEMGAYQLFSTSGGEADGGLMTRPPQVPAPFWSFYVQVDGVEAAVARLKAGGGALINGPMQVPGGAWIAQAIDPQGAMFSLTSPNA